MKPDEKTGVSIGPFISIPKGMAKYRVWGNGKVEFFDDSLVIGSECVLVGTRIIGKINIKLLKTLLELSNPDEEEDRLILTISESGMHEGYAGPVGVKEYHLAPIIDSECKKVEFRKVKKA